MLIKEEILLHRITKRHGSRITRVLVFDSECDQIRWEDGRNADELGALVHGDHELILVNREQWDKAPHLRPGRYLGLVISHHIAGEKMDRCLADCDECIDYRQASVLYLMRGE